MMGSGIDVRLKVLIEALLPSRNRYKTLESFSSISCDIWKNYWFDRRKPDAEMIGSVAAHWPQHAFWLATGKVDVEHGHTAPHGVKAPQIKRVSTFATAG